MPIKSPDPELTINLWPIRIVAKGNDAIRAVAGPVAVVLYALALLLILFAFSNFGYNNADAGRLPLKMLFVSGALQG
jgi:hypothetical protein